MWRQLGAQLDNSLGLWFISLAGVREDTMRRCFAVALGLFLPACVLSGPAIGSGPSITLLPSSGPWGDQAFLGGLSPDGSTVWGFGFQTATNASQRPLLWRPGTGVSMVPGLDTREAYVWAMNSDGTVMTGGYSVNVTSEAPFVYVAGSGVRSLGIPSNYGSLPEGMSRDGRFIAGESGLNGWRAARWETATGAVQVLPQGPSGLVPNFSGPISADGSVVAGTGKMPGGQVRVFRWTEETGAVPIVPVPADNAFSDPVAISADGSIVLGRYWRSANNIRPWLWSEAGGLQLLPSSPTWTPRFMSADGSIVGGDGYFWTPERGLQTTQAFFAERGLTNVPGVCDAMSDDGTVFVMGVSTSFGSNFYYVTIPAPGAASIVLIAGAVIAVRRRRNRTLTSKAASWPDPPPPR